MAHRWQRTGVRADGRREKRGADHGPRRTSSPPGQARSSDLLYATFRHRRSSARCRALPLYLLSGYEQPYFLTVPVIEYKNPLWPVNPLAEQDGDALQVFFPSHDKRSVAIESQSRPAPRRAVEWPQNRETSHHHRFFHLCALARFVTDKDGKNGTVYIIPKADAGPDDRPVADFMIPLDDVINAMRAPVRRKTSS